MEIIKDAPIGRAFARLLQENEEETFGKLFKAEADREYAIFAKDKAQGSDNPNGYPTPETQYFTNKCAAAAASSLSERALRAPPVDFSMAEKYSSY